MSKTSTPEITKRRVTMRNGIPKFDAKELTRRRSSPRLMVYDTALMSAVSDKGRNRILGEGDLRGRMAESSVGASLLARAPEEGFELFWWREGTSEVDFVASRNGSLSAIEVKGGGEARRRHHRNAALGAYRRRHSRAGGRLPRAGGKADGDQCGRRPRHRRGGGQGR